MGVYNNFIIQKGATWEQNFFWVDSNQYPINLTNYSAKFQMKKVNDDDAQLIEYTPTLTALTGKIYLHLSPTQTSALNVGFYKYELELKYPANSLTPDIYRIIEGQLYVSDEVG